MLIQAKDAIILGTFLWLILFTIRIFNFKKVGKKINIKNEVFLNLFAIYLIGLVAVTLFPIRLGMQSMIPPYDYEPSFFQKYAFNLAPFVNLISKSSFDNSTFLYYALRTILGNLILLTPLTMYLCLKSSKLRKLKSALFISLCTSFFIEFFQFIENLTGLSYPSFRTINIDDLILNTLGALLGYFIVKLLLNSRFKKFITLEKNIFS